MHQQTHILRKQRQQQLVRSSSESVMHSNAERHKSMPCADLLTAFGAAEDPLSAQ
jgi:hypothetical protein